MRKKGTPQESPFLTVEFQTEVDLSTGDRVKRRFVKMYTEARDSGLLADIPDDLWKTLSAMALYVDEDGYCSPSQARIGRDLGISRQGANGRINRLERYRFRGRPVLSTKRRRETAPDGSTRWGRNVYFIHPISGLKYGRAKPPEGPVSACPDTGPVSGTPVSGRPDINKKCVEKKNTRGVLEGGGGELVRLFHDHFGRTHRKPKSRELDQAHSLIESYGEEKSRYVVEYALCEAQRTKYPMQHFGAVMDYAEDAVADFDKALARSVRDAHQTRRLAEDDARVRYEAWKRNEIRAAADRLPDGERARLVEAASRAVSAEFGEKPMAEATLVRIELYRLLEPDLGIPSFSEWRSRESLSRDSPSKTAS